MTTYEQKQKTPVRTAAAAAILGLAAVLLLVAALLLIDGRHVRFYVTGADEISICYGLPFEEPGVRAVAVGRLTGENEDGLPVTVSGTVDPGRLGDYTLRYTASTMFRSYSVERLVHVVDQRPPEIRLVSDPNYLPNWLDGYAEEGFTATDDVDGDLTAQVSIVTDGDARIYTVTDAAGNTGTEVRQLTYSIGRPILTLSGGEELQMNAGFTFEDPGCTATDARGNNLSALVHREGEVVPYAAGEYELRYSIENAVGERVEAVRHVTVNPLRNPDTVEPGSKVIYLTFDDGPGPYTDRLLDVLARYNVRATFFVTCRYPDYFDCIGRAFREGHSIGVHSATHDYYTVYASEDAFFEDFNAVEELILAQTGETTTLCRFPGGSSNTVSRFNRGIMTRLTKAVETMGYQYFDWNVTSGDAGETTSTEQVYSNIVEGCLEQEPAVVLQHDIKDFSVDAVERVIVWALNNGYTFAALDPTSPTTHHRVAN